MNWQLQDAKNQFSKVVQLARSEGPQTVTLRGEPTAVVLSINDFNALQGNRPSFIEALLSGPEWDDEFINDVNNRNKKPDPEIDF